MDCNEDTLPIHLQRVITELERQLSNLSHTQFRRLFSLVIKEEGMGERIVLSCIKEKFKDRMIIIEVPREGLKEYDTQLISLTFKDFAKVRLSEDSFKDISRIECPMDSVRRTISLTEHELKNNVLLVLNLQDVPNRYWPTWRTFVEDDIANVLIICTKDQWDTAQLDVPELTGCSSMITLDQLLSEHDEDEVRRLLRIELKEPLTDTEERELFTMMGDDWRSISRRHLQEHIWEIFLKRRNEG